MLDLNKSFKLAIDGMKCPECQEAVKKALSKIPGVSDVAVNLEKGTAEGKLSGLVNKDALIAVIDKLGFKAKDASEA